MKENTNRNNDVTKEIKVLINALERKGEQNDYTLYCESASLEKLQNILENIFKK